MWNKLWKSSLLQVLLAVVIVGLAVGCFVPATWLWFWYVVVSGIFWLRVYATIRKSLATKCKRQSLFRGIRLLLRVGCVVLWLLIPGLLIDYAGPVLRFFGNMTMKESFYATVADCNRIVIRDGGYSCCSGARFSQAPLVEITDPAEVKAFVQALQFTDRSLFVCRCCGYPGIDFYRGEERLALTAIQHGDSMRWQGFGMAEMNLANSTRQFLAEFFRRHGIGKFPGDIPEEQ